MPRIPEDEIERLKNEISLERLVSGAGVELKKSGKDMVGRCPFHEDETASLVVTPAKNLWHCFGCGLGGGVLDWVMKKQGVSFRHAVELLREDSSLVAGPTVRVLAAPVSFDADDAALLRQTMDYYHERLHCTQEAQAYLAARGLTHPELIDHFHLGVGDRTLGLRLPEKTRKAGAEIRARLQHLGLMRETGHEHFNGSLVVPILDEAGAVLEVYGRKLREDLRPGTPKHLYLPRVQAGRGVFNIAALGEEVILCEALIDAMTFWCAGWRSVTSAYGVEGFTEEMLEVFKQRGVRRVLIAFDRDEAGDRGADKVAPLLMVAGMECWRIEFPKGMDANEYALKVQPADKSLGLLIRKAAWLGKGVAPSREGTSPSSSLAAKEEPPEAVHVEAPQPEFELEGDVLKLVCGPRVWQVRGVPKGPPGASLKLNLRVQGEALHVDSVDLYSARARSVFCTQAAAELGGRDDLQAALSRELGRVLLAVEQVIAERERAAHAPKVLAPVMSEEDHAAALAWLRSPGLLERIAADFDACGLVGEATNKLTAYLACVSRLLSNPLAVLVQSSSAAGKTSLMDAVLAFMPPESRIRYSAMTGQSLYYMGQTDLKHRILALAEEEGAARASYALKLLQSDGELTMAATGKDPVSGNLVTQEYHVEGPVMLMLTTTAIEIDDELMNRCLVLTVDEGSEQTRAIHARQRSRRTLEGLMAGQRKQDIQALHQHAQRLLRPLAVVNPFADQLSFHASQARARRDHEKYLSLIDAVTLLHQHQRPVQQARNAHKTVEYIEVTRADIEAAHGIAHEVLGRSLDELPPITRKLLQLLSAYVTEQASLKCLAKDELRFTRRELRESCGWGDTQLRLHLQRLVELELLSSERGGPGGQWRYTLRCEVSATGECRLTGLVNPAELVEPAAMTSKSRGSNLQVADNSRGEVAQVAGKSRVLPLAAEPVSMRLAEAKKEVAGFVETHIRRREELESVLSYTQA